MLVRFLKRVSLQICPAFALFLLTACVMHSSPFHKAQLRVINPDDPLLVGDRAFRQKDYETAIKYYEQVLEMEKQERTLSYDYFIVLIDNLGKAYANTKQWPKSKATFKYGTSIYPTYPNFYANLTCLYARENNIDAVAANLEKAYRYRKNTLPGEYVVVPFRGSCLQNVWDDPRIKEFIGSHDFTL